MNFFNLFYKNLIGCKIKESDLMCNDKIKVNNFNYSVVSLTPKYSVEKYKIDKLIDKLKTDNRNYTLNDYETFNDQIQKITDELNELKLINTTEGREGGTKRKKSEMEESEMEESEMEESEMEESEKEESEKEESEKEESEMEVEDEVPIPGKKPPLKKIKHNNGNETPKYEINYDDVYKIIKTSYYSNVLDYDDNMYEFKI